MFSGFTASSGLPPYLNPPSTSRGLPEHIPRSYRSHQRPLRDHSDRYLPSRTPEERQENQRLESHRQQLITSMASSSSSGTESPGPALPRSIRQRAANLSEGEISVLDLGPSLQTTPTPISRVRHNTCLLNDNSELYTALAGLATDYDGNARRLRTEDLESEAVSSASGDVPNPHPLSERQRRQNMMIQRGLGPASSGPRPVRQLRDSRVASSSDVQNLGHRYGYGYGYSMQDNQLHFSDEPSNHIMARSVPHSPGSPPAPLRRVLYSTNYYSIISPEQSNLRNVEQASSSTPADGLKPSLDIDEHHRNSETG
jgi:hypothetical protein